MRAPEKLSLSLGACLFVASAGMALYAVGGPGPNAGHAAASDGLSVLDGTQTGLDHPPDIVPSASEDSLSPPCPSPEPEEVVSDEGLEADESADAACPGPEELISDEGGVQALDGLPEGQWPPGYFLTVYPYDAMYVSFSGGISLEAIGGPDGGTYYWPVVEGTGYGEIPDWGGLEGARVLYKSCNTGNFPVTVEYTVQGNTIELTRDDLTVFAADMDVQGVPDGHPLETLESEVGAFLAVGGPRRKVTLRVEPDIIPEDPFPSGEWWNAWLTVDKQGVVAFYTQEEGGEPLTELNWGTRDDPENTPPYRTVSMPQELWVQGLAADVVNVTFHFGIHNWFFYGYPQLSWAADADTVRFTVVRVEIVQPRDTNGDGEINDPDNEFSFNAADPATLWFWCAAHQSPQPENFRWRVDDIGSVRGVWNPHVEGDPHTGRGQLATVTFTGMPENNSDFGRKLVRLRYVGLDVEDTEPIEVFFDPLARNNPGPEPDDIPSSIDLREVVVRAKR